jgi:hypothetical protein
MQLPPLDPRKRRAAQFLANGLSRNETAKRLGINPATLSLWRRNPEFTNYIDSLLGTQDKESIQALYALKQRAVEKLGTLLDSKIPAVALRAADLILQKTLTTFSAPTVDELSAASKAWEIMQKELEKISQQAYAEQPQPQTEKPTNEDA